MEDLASTLPFVQASSVNTNVLWDESHALLMVYLSVSLQCYGICRSLVILLGEADSLLNFTRREFGCYTEVFPFLAFFFFFNLSNMARSTSAHIYKFLQNAIDKY